MPPSAHLKGQQTKYVTSVNLKGQHIKYVLSCIIIKIAKTNIVVDNLFSNLTIFFHIVNITHYFLKLFNTYVNLIFIFKGPIGRLH